MATFEVPGKPQGKARARVTMRGAYARAYTPDTTTNYEGYVKLCYRQSVKGFHEPVDALKMVITAVFPIPASFSRKKRADALAGLVRPTVKPDCDNIGKIIADALNAFAYADDKQICEMTIRKVYGEESKVIVTIEKIEV